MQNRSYFRDGRAPVPQSESISRVMSANRAKNTKPELTLRKALWAAGLRSYRLHLKNMPGRPDIAFPKKRVAVFVNGCYWHRCPNCHPHEPKTNVAFWKNKFEKNVARDERKRLELVSAGWKVIVLWECALKSDVARGVRQIARAL